ncbi:MAG TPA: AAA family ATPase [Syntrophomonadaceae bacterium]|nr:AAA family ATPase [Syntrophomonadaceae bacterium]
MANQQGNLIINLLGKPIILQNDNPLNIKRKKCRGIIYYLAAHNNPISRYALQEIFWPEHDFSTAQHNLNVHLSEIRRQIPNLIQGDNSSVQISSEIKIDTRLFEMCIEKSDEEELQKTLLLYRGDFLDGFTIDNSPEYDNWKLEQQEHFKIIFTRGLAKLAEFCDNRGEYLKGIFALQQALKIDPLQEELYRSTMLLHYHAGDILKVNQTYKKLKKVLDEELGVLPMSETQALYDAMINNKLLGELGYSSHKNRHNYNVTKKYDLIGQYNLIIPFTGRDKELKQIEDLSHKNGLIIIEGAPGSGKTRLIEEFMQRWEGLILYGCCIELEIDINYHPFTEAIRRFIRATEWKTLQEDVKNEMGPFWWNELRCFVPEIDLHDKTNQYIANDKYALMEAVSQFINILSQKQKLLIVIDDLQWGDNPSIGLLGYLVRQSSDMHICL